MKGFLQSSAQKHSTSVLQDKFYGLPSSAAVGAHCKIKSNLQTDSSRKLATVTTMSSATPAQQSTAAPDAKDSALQSTPAIYDPIVQYVILRKDLWGPGFSWPLGSIVAQACHASSAAMWLHRDDDDTATYCSPENLDSMHKVREAGKGNNVKSFSLLHSLS